MTGATEILTDEVRELEQRFPLFERRPAPPAFKTIVLEKVRRGSCDDAAPLPGWRRPRCVEVGTRMPYTYKSLTRDQALQRASKMLTATWADEDRLNWKEVHPS